MIIVFEGTPGSGKSYDAVQKVIDNLKKGRVVYTNLEGMEEENHQEHLKAMCGLGDWEFSQLFHFLDGSNLKEFWKVVTKGAMIVIDEAHKIYNSRDWQSQLNRDCANWCSTHRHGGYDVVFITQAIEKLDSQIRTLVEFTYRYRKINFLGSLVQNGYLVYPFSGDDTAKPMAAPFKRFYNKDIFACYKSYVTKDIKELGIMQHYNILKHPVFYLIPVVLIGFIYFFSKSSFAHGRLFPEPKGLVTKALAEGVVSSNTVTVLPLSPLVQEKKERVRPVVSGKRSYLIKGKADSLGSAIFVLCSEGSNTNITMSNFKLDEACRCNSIARLSPGDTVEF